MSTQPKLKTQNSIKAFGQSYKATDLVDRNIAADYLKVSPTTVSKWAKIGKLPARNEGTRKTRFLVRDLIDINAGKQIGVINVQPEKKKTKPLLQVDLEYEITGWFDERCYQKDGVVTMTSILYENFVDWMHTVRKIPMDSIPALVRFTRELKEMGFTQTKPRETYYDIGLKVKQRIQIKNDEPVIFFGDPPKEEDDSLVVEDNSVDVPVAIDMETSDIDISMIYVKFRNGEPFTDEELVAGIEHFQSLAELAFMSGPEFRMMARTAREVSMRLNDYYRARTEDV